MVEGSMPPVPPSIIRSVTLPNFSSISSGSVMYSMSSPFSSGRVVVRIGASSRRQISRMIALSGTRIPTSFRLRKFGQPAVGVQNEGERAGQVTFHQLESGVAHLCIFADVTQVVADDGQVVLAWVDIFQLADTFDGPFFQGVTPDGIHRIGGIDKDSAVVQQVDYALQVFRSIVLGYNFSIMAFGHEDETS